MIPEPSVSLPTTLFYNRSDVATIYNPALVHSNTYHNYDDATTEYILRSLEKKYGQPSTAPKFFVENLLSTKVFSTKGVFDGKFSPLRLILKYKLKVQIGNTSL